MAFSSKQEVRHTVSAIKSVLGKPQPFIRSFHSAFISFNSLWGVPVMLAGGRVGQSWNTDPCSWLGGPCSPCDIRVLQTLRSPQTDSLGACFELYTGFALLCILEAFWGQTLLCLIPNGASSPLLPEPQLCPGLPHWEGDLVQG